MSKFIILALCVFSLLWSEASAGLVPPRGYTVGFKGSIRRGYQKYVCNRGSWTKTSSSGDVYSTLDGSKLATYRSAVDPKTGALTYFWNVINGAGGFHESGSAVSGLQGVAVKSVTTSPQAMSQYLAIVKKHTGSGDADNVAFVSLTGTRGGLPPRKALCSTYGATSSVPFTGTFQFYNQDLSPPDLPPSLTPKGNFIQVVHLQGKAVYRFMFGKWVYQGLFVTISNVAGSAPIGSFGTVANKDRYGSKLYFKVNEPNGFWLRAQQCASPVQVYADGCAWQLLKITTAGGYQTPMGPYKNMVIASTMGGTAPKIAARGNGYTYGSPMTALGLLYA